MESILTLKNRVVVSLIPFCIYTTLFLPFFYKLTSTNETILVIEIMITQLMYIASISFIVTNIFLSFYLQKIQDRGKSIISNFWRPTFLHVLAYITFICLIIGDACILSILLDDFSKASFARTPMLTSSILLFMISPCFLSSRILYINGKYYILHAQKFKKVSQFSFDASINTISLYVGDDCFCISNKTTPDDLKIITKELINNGIPHKE